MRNRIGLVFAGLLFSLCFLIQFAPSVSQADQSGPRFGGVFRIKPFETQFSTQLDPIRAESHIFISEQLFNGLVHLDRNLKVVPSLAEYWKVSPDGKVYTFYLKKGVKFHTGEVVTASDVKYSFERILDPQTESPYSLHFLDRVVGARSFNEGRASSVKGFRVVDEHIFEITWTRPYVFGLYLMSLHFCKILPREMCENRGNRFFQRPCGTGPFKFAYWIRSPKLEILGIRLERNEEYFEGRPYLDAIEFSPLYTLDHFMNREIDFIPVLSNRLLKPDYQLRQEGAPHLFLLGIGQHQPPLDNLDVRKAVLYALDKTQLIIGTYDMRYTYNVTNSFYPPQLPGFLPRASRHSHSPIMAERSLKSAGFENMADFPPLTLFIEGPRTDSKHRFFRELRDQLQAVGISLRIQYYPSLDEVKEFSGPYLILWEKRLNFPDPEDIIRPLFHSNGNFNVFGFRESSVDDLLDRAEVEQSWSKRIKYFQQIEKILNEQIPAVPLFFSQSRVAFQRRVKNIEIHPLGMDYLEVRKIWVEK
ncbi:ABC transporter substrate-binding protein [Acidobacteriota bacterium]